MSTRATIQFKDPHDTYFVYRHCDGFPENIMPDLRAVIEKAKGRWSEPEVALLVTLFLASNYDTTKRLPNYELTSSFHGDESYKYYVEWDAKLNTWKSLIK